MPPQGEQMVPLTFPRCGLDLSRAFAQQQPRPMADGTYGRTTPRGVNVRTYEPTTNRARGGQRAGLSRYLDAQPNGTRLIQELATLVGVGYTPPGGSMQTSQSGRVVTLVAVSGGNIYAASPGGTSWVQATNNTSRTTPLNTSGVVMSSSLNQKLYLVDGTNFCVYDPATNAVSDVVATSGTLPVGTDGGTPRLIATWRGSLVLGGLVKDSQNWFISAVGDATNWNYFPNDPTVAQAIAGNNSPLGLIGDTITTFISYTDDVLICGGDSSIYQFQGDPRFGGQIAPITRSIGMAWGAPWCMGPDGTIYFFSNRTGIFAMTPGQGPPQRISQQIDNLLLPIDTGASTIRMIWNDRFQGLQVYVSPTGSADDSATHFFWEQRAGAWWEDQYAISDMNPLCCTVFDGNDPGDRVALIGSWDGYVRAIDPTATDDDGTAIRSSVVIGPFNTPNLDEMTLTTIQAVLGEDSADVTYYVYVARTAEAAMNDLTFDEAVRAGTQTGSLRYASRGTWSAGHNLSNYVNRAGHAGYLLIDGLSPWALEQIRLGIKTRGTVRMRGR